MNITIQSGHIYLDDLPRAPREELLIENNALPEARLKLLGRKLLFPASLTPHNIRQSYQFSHLIFISERDKNEKQNSLPAANFLPQAAAT